MTDPHAGPGPGGPSDAPDHPEPDPRLRGFPPPAPPGAMAYSSRQVAQQPYPGQPYPYPFPAYGPPPLLPALPTEPSRYSSLLRGPRYRWWKPLLSLALALALYLGFVVVTVLPPLVAGLVTGVPDLASYVLDTLTNLDDVGPVAFVAMNLALVVLIPTVMLSVWIVHGVRPRFLSSVTGGIRWRWLLRCLLLLLPLWLLYLGVTLLFGLPTGARPTHWVALLVIVAVMTPFQAAGEEYAFRGWILQNVGAWFARPVVGLVVATVVSTVVFAFAHGSLDIWVLGSIGCLAVAGCLATWRTGGLEAAIVMHTVNNVLVFVLTVAVGGWQGAFVQSGTRGTPVEFLLSLAVHGAALALVWWQAGKVGLPYLSRPSVVPALPGPPPPLLGLQNPAADPAG